MLKWYDLWGNEVTENEARVLWEKKMTEDYGRIGLDEVGPYQVSTVWLGIDHDILSGMDGGPPVLWETMIFRRPSMEPHQCIRYTSFPLAVAGHDAAVAEYRAKVSEDNRNG